MAIPTEKMVTEWIIDTDGAVRSVKQLTREFRDQDRLVKQRDVALRRLGITTDSIAESSRKMANSMKRNMANIKAGFDMMTGAVKSAAAAMDKVFTRGQELQKMYDAQTISITHARTATKGFISDAELLKGANTAAAFQLGFTAEQFGEVAKSATIAAQKIGGDVNKAMTDFMTGVARQSKPILDNLGIQLADLNTINDEFAKSLGKTAKELTATEKKAAFTAAAMEGLKKVVGDTKLEVSTAGDHWAVMKTNIANTYDQFALMVSNSPAILGFFNDMSEAIQYMFMGTIRLNKAIADFQASFVKTKFVDPLSVRDKPADFLKAGPATGSRAKKAAKKGTGGIGRGAGGVLVKGDGDLPEEAMNTAGLTEQITQYQGLSEMIQRLTSDQEELNQAVAGMAPAMSEADIAALQFSETMSTAFGELKDIGMSALSGFADGLFTVMEAAIQSGQAAEVAMLKLVKSVLMGIAKMAAVKAIFYLAEFFGTFNPASLIAAGMFAGVAALAGGAAIAVGTAIPSSTSSAKSSSASAARKTDTTKPSFGKKIEDKRPINVNVFIGDPADPSTALLTTKQVQAAVAR